MPPSLFSSGLGEVCGNLQWQPVITKRQLQGQLPVQQGPHGLADPSVWQRAEPRQKAKNNSAAPAPETSKAARRVLRAR